MESESGKKSVILESIAPTLPDPIFIIDEKGVYVEVIGGIERTLYRDHSKTGAKQTCPR